MTAFAAFPRGVDGLLMAPAAQPVFLLVEQGRPEQRWVDSFAPARALAYRLTGDAAMQTLTTGELLARSNIAEVMRGAGVSRLFLHGSRTREIERWARSERLGLIAAAPRLARALEHKITFDAFLAEHRVAKPRSVAGAVRTLDPLPFAHGAVAQQPESMGGEGTFFLAPGEPLTSLVDTGMLRAGEPCLVRERVPGDALGVTMLVGHTLCALSSLRSQAYFPGKRAAVRRQFAGVQWLPHGTLPRLFVRRVERVLARLARALHERGYRGFANIDFIRTPDDQLRVIECNPRPSAATPSLYAWPELIHGLSADRLYVEALSKRVTSGERPRFLGLPRTDFAGANLDLPASFDAGARRVTRTFTPGVYTLARSGIGFLSPDPAALTGRGKFLAFHSTRPGDRFTGDDTLVNIVCSEPLLDASGRLDSRGKRVFEACKVTV